MRYVVVVWRLGYQGGADVYEDGIIGPFRTEEAAERKATAIRKEIERVPWDEEGDRPDGVTVQPLNPGRTPARDAVVAHLVPDVGC